MELDEKLRRNRQNRNDIDKISQELVNELEHKNKQSIDYDDKKFNIVRNFVNENALITTVINDLYGENEKYVTLSIYLPCIMIKPIKEWFKLSGKNIFIKSTSISKEFIIKEELYNNRDEFYRSILIDDVSQDIYYNAGEWGYYIKNFLSDIVFDDNLLF